MLNLNILRQLTDSSLCSGGKLPSAVAFGLDSGGTHPGATHKVLLDAHAQVPVGSGNVHQPGQGIVEAVETHGCKMIVMGTRGFGKIKRTMKMGYYPFWIF